MSIWLAKLLGPVVVALSIPMMFRPKRLLQITEEFLEQPALILISGILAMIAGVAIINTHNLWMFRWPVIITLFGWALALGGAVRIIAPDLIKRMGEPMIHTFNLTRAAGALWGAIGLALIFNGYR